MIKKIIGFLILLISFNTIAQRNNISPYSFFGIGDNTASKSVEEIGMGEIGGAFNSTYQLGFTNPASYSFLRFTTYALAGENKALRIDDGANKDSGSAAALSYLALGFPIGKNAGLAFGLQPNTTVGYSLLQEFVNDDETELNLFAGEGGTNKAFVGFGHKIGKEFSLGLEISYIFGTIENSLLNRRSTAPLATMQKSDSDLSGASVKAGVQYQTKISEKLTLKTGATVDLSNKLTNEGSEFRFSLINVSNGSIIARDTTLVNSFDLTVKNPLKTVLSVGIGQENKWYAGLEYSFQDALIFDDGFSLNNTNFNYKKANRISVGGFYTPKFNSVTNYWQRLTYRAGFSYKQTGLVVNNTDINNFGISFGVGLPIGRQLSTINLGFELGQRGEATNDLVKENYFNFRLGLSLSDKWFRKRQLD